MQLRQKPSRYPPLLKSHANVDSVPSLCILSLEVLPPIVSNTLIGSRLPPIKIDKK